MLGRFPCVRVETIVISKTGIVSIAPRVLVQEWLVERPLPSWGFVKLDYQEVELLAWNDGFRFDAKPAWAYPSTHLMMQFWKVRLPFMGYIIHWSHSRALTDVSNTGIIR